MFQMKYEGLDRFKARKKLFKLSSIRLLKIEDYKNKVGFSERTNVIEPRLSKQWF